ncbi:MAG: hypothetical protein OFPI_42640 [Osedax symbiont Rs2]|nr:MAG: hypothetical protein OFPI_42640 [Osedax symbiont Rs2]
MGENTDHCCIIQIENIAHAAQNIIIGHEKALGYEKRSIFSAVEHRHKSTSLD